MTATAATPVTMNTSANNKAKIALSVLLVLMLGLFGFGWVQDWGFVGMFWIGVGILGFGAGLVGQLMGGGFAQADCPSCGHTLEFTNPKDHRVERCEKCGTYAHGVDSMSVVPDDYVHDTAVFTSPFNPDDLRWPRTADDQLACPVTGGPAELEELEVQDASLGVMLGVGGKVTTYKLMVPMSPEHKDGIDLQADEEKEGQINLVFRSRAYHLAYEKLNR